MTEISHARKRMKAFLMCDPLDRKFDPYRGDQDQYHKDLYAIRDEYFSIMEALEGANGTGDALDEVMCILERNCCDVE